MALDPKEDLMTRIVCAKDVLNAFLHEAARMGIDLDLFVGMSQPMFGADGLVYTAKQVFFHRID